jgi:serine/threonine-protein kinase
MDIGDQFERYTITGVIGAGGMGRVFRAHDPKLGRDVAIKVLLPGEAGADAKARMLREARAAAALSHPNAVAIYDVGETDSTDPYIVMELVVGRSLRELVSDDDVLLSEKLHWLEEIAAALGAAHDRGIVHRDVKPDNVLVRADGAAKVLDFGIARRAASALDPSAPTEAGLPTLTEAGVQVGTPLYMAPEQIRGDAVDGRADQFAWAVVAYELCTGKLPWRTDRGALGATASILTDSPAPMADVPAALEATIRRALSKDPADRFPSMRELLVALRAIDPTVRLRPAPAPAPAARPRD